MVSVSRLPDAQRRLLIPRIVGHRAHDPRPPTHEELIVLAGENYQVLNNGTPAGGGGGRHNGGERLYKPSVE
jgi:hypothetical protein